MRNKVTIEIMETKQVKNQVTEEIQNMSVTGTGVYIEAIENTKEIFSRMKKELQVDAMVAFAFKSCNEGVLVSSYIGGDFCEKYLLHVIEGALRYHDFVEKRREELEAEEYDDDFLGGNNENF